MRLIDADELLKQGKNLSWSVQKWVSEVDIGLMPTIDAEPIRHGRWEDKSVAFYRVCSECGAVVRQNTDEIFLHSCMIKVGRLNYCPNCGAKMDEVMK